MAFDLPACGPPTSFSVNLASCAVTQAGSVYKSDLGKGATREFGKYLFGAANVWWRCAQYCVIVSCG